MPIAEVKNVTKVYRMGSVDFTALHGISISIEPKEFLALTGSSGSGKTTLLNILGLLDSATSGEHFYESMNCQVATENELARTRAEKMGFIFQTFNLIPVLSALENVEYPMLLLNQKKRDRLDAAHAALAKVGLEKFIHHKPSELSGGQRQRVAIARALVKKPQIIFADEPTANLDRKSALEIMADLKKLNAEGCTIVFSSHDPEMVKFASRVVRIVDGRRAD